MGNLYQSKPNFLFASDQNELLSFIEDARTSYDRALVNFYKKRNKEDFMDDALNKKLQLYEHFLKGVSEFQYLIKHNKYPKEKLYQVEKELDLYFLFYDHEDENYILNRQRKIINWLQSNKIDT
jgi:hypothetical protein